MTASAQQSDDKNRVVVRLANPLQYAMPVEMTLMGGATPFVATQEVIILTAADPMAANTPSNPTAVSPTASHIQNGKLLMPPYSVAVVVFKREKGP